VATATEMRSPVQLRRKHWAVDSRLRSLPYWESREPVPIPGESVGEYWTKRIEQLLRACVADRGSLPKASTIDVPFHEFMADGVATVENIYAKAGLEMTAQARSELQHYLAEHPRGKEGKLVYDLEGQLGIDREELRKRFQFYFDAFSEVTGSRL
jgi:hypothetical protein